MAPKTSAMRRRAAHVALVCATLTGIATAQTETYYFTGAVQVTGSSSSGYSPAVQAQCPSDHPVSCSSISEGGYCCPSGNICAWSNSQVSCCPSGQTCTAQGANYQQQTTEYQPTTTYYTPTTTQYEGYATTEGGGGVIVPAGYATEGQGQTTVYNTGQQTTQQVVEGGNYCSTLYAHGPNLPTTAAGQCGTILVEEASEGFRREVKGWVRLGVVVVVLQAMGGVLLVRR